METRHLGCPNCGAPLDVLLGEVEALCEYCRSKLRFVPEENELEVLRTREEMKHRERIAVEKQILRNQLEHEEMDRWRETASKVAIAAQLADAGIHSIDAGSPAASPEEIESIQRIVKEVPTR